MYCFFIIFCTSWNYYFLPQICIHVVYAFILFLFRYHIIEIMLYYNYLQILYFLVRSSMHINNKMSSQVTQMNLIKSCFCHLSLEINKNSYHTKCCFSSIQKCTKIYRYLFLLLCIYKFLYNFIHVQYKNTCTRNRHQSPATTTVYLTFYNTKYSSCTFKHI